MTPKLPLALAAFALCSTVAFAADLVVKIDKLKHAGGEVILGVFPEGGGFPDDSTKVVAGGNKAPKDGAVTFTFKGLKPGKYAVIAFHDLNTNTDLDLNFFGAPKEPWGSSAKKRPKFRAPTFDEASFEVVEGKPTVVEVNLK